jgi:hypothetical protein
MNRPILLLFCTLLLLANCKEKQRTRANKINKITFAVGGDCYNGRCDHFVLSVDSSLNYTYYGGKMAKKEGYYKGKISQGKWDTLNIRFEHLQSSPYSSDSLVSFHPGLAIETFIYSAKTTKHVVGFSHNITDDWLKYFSWLRDSLETNNLISTVPIAFETTVQNPQNLRIIDSLQKKEDKAWSQQGIPSGN